MAPGESPSLGSMERRRCKGANLALCLLVSPVLLAVAAAAAVSRAGAAQAAPRSAAGAATDPLASTLPQGGAPSAPAVGSCGGVLLAYRVLVLRPIAFPGASAFQFNASLILTNIGRVALRSPWQLRFNFTHSEVITAVQGANLAPGAVLPLAGKWDT